MSLKKRAGVCLLSFIFFFICCFTFGFDNNKALFVTAVPTVTKTVIVDAGHGGFDGGAVADDGTPEKDINLKIALKLAEMLRLHGFSVILTRRDDSGTETDPTDSIANRKKSDMTERLNIINSNPDAVFVSIHLNKFTTSSARGAQVFYSPNDERSALLGLAIQQTVAGLLQPENTRTIKKGTKSTYLLYRAKIPAVIVECGFLSNKTELELLKSEEYQSKMAFAILCGILNYGS